MILDASDRPIDTSWHDVHGVDGGIETAPHRRIKNEFG